MTVSSDSTRAEGLARLLFVGSLVVAFLACLTIVSRPMLSLVSVVPDDTFYYLKVARTFGATGYSSFDGINPTNGYHPAWMFLLAFLSRIVPDREGFVRATLLLSTALHLATCLVMVKVLQNWMRRTTALLGGALYALYPLGLYMSVMALESNLYSLFLLTTVLTYLRRIAPHVSAGTLREVSTRDWAVLGACFAFTFLGRTEGVMYFACFILFVAIRLRHEGREGRVAALFRPALAIVLPFVLIISPWLLFCKRLVGHMAQDSGGMKMLWAFQGSLPARVVDALTHHVPDLFRFIFVNLVVIPTAATFGFAADEGSGGTRKALGAIGCLLILLVFAALVRAARRKGYEDPRGALFVWLGGGVLLSGAVYGLFFADMQPWYAGAPGMVVFLIGFGLLGPRLERRSDSASTATPVLVPALALMALAAIRFALHPPLEPRQPAVYASQPRFERLVPLDARIGSFNAGIPGYFSDRTVINLDGLVNSAAVPYWKEKRFDAYLRDARIGYIFDDETIAKGEAFSTGPIPRVVLDQVPLDTQPPETRWAWKLLLTPSPDLRKAEPLSSAGAPLRPHGVS